MLWRCWLGGRKGIRPVKTEWWGAGVVICLEQDADLHIAQLMPLPLTVSCFSKIQIGFTFLVPAHPGSPGKRAVKRVCVCVCLFTCSRHIWELCWRNPLAFWLIYYYLFCRFFLHNVIKKRRLVLYTSTFSVSSSGYMWSYQCMNFTTKILNCTLLWSVLQEADGKETALIIDRYKYLDLFPCAQTELKSLGYRVSKVELRQSSVRVENVVYHCKCTVH